MKRFLSFSIMMLMLVTSCGVLPSAPATLTPLPTDTPQPTSTPLPTDTPTPVPTSTPDKTATAAAKATETSSAVLQELDALLGDSDIPYQDGYLLWKQTKPILVNMRGPARDYIEIDDDLVAENFILKSDVTWEASGIIICSMIFRSEPNVEKGKQYQFGYLRLSGLPVWEIGIYELGRFKSSPSKTQFSDAIDQNNGATNQVALVVQGEQFTVYINKVNQGTYYDHSKQRTDGFFAFNSSQDSGRGKCNYENSWVWALR